MTYTETAPQSLVGILARKALQASVGATFAPALSLGATLTPTPVTAQDTSSPPVRDNPTWPSDAEAEELLNELFYQRAIHS